MKNLGFIISKIKKYKFRYIIGIILLCTYVFINLKLINILGSTIDMLGQESININSINKNVGEIIFFSILHAVLVMVWRPLIYSGAKKVKKDLHKEIYNHVCSIPYQYFTTKTHGDLLSYLHNDVEYVENLLSEKVIVILTSVFNLIISIVYLALKMPSKLTYLTIGALCGSAILLYYFTFGMTKKYEEARDLKLKNSSKIQQIVSGIKTIKRFNKMEECIDNFRKHAFNLEEKEMNLVKRKSMVIFSVDVYMQVAYALILIYAGMHVISGSMTIGRFIEFTSYFSLLCVQNIKLSAIIPDIKQINVSVYKIRKFLKIKNETDSKPLIKMSGDKLTLKRLTANPYVTEGVNKNILNNVSFELNKGDTLGIIGRMGSGKSTLVNILSEIYQVEDNMVLIDKIDINKVSKDSIRNIVEIIPEDNYIFSDTIFNNITFYNEKYSIQQVEEACRKTFLHKQIKRMPLKYDTVVGDNGIYLTVGQKQRLRIARSFLTNKKIIIFDECFSGIEVTMCEKIIDNIKRELKDKIIVIISNNIDNIKWCDKIIVMEEGKIVEKGSHKELIMQDMIYKKMYQFQRKINGG